MILDHIFQSGLIEDNTMIAIRDGNFNVLAVGNWYQDNVLKYLNNEVESFTWQDNAEIYVDVK